MLYTVYAEFERSEVADEYLNWLLNGHLAAVLAGGATSAQVVRLDGGPPYKLEVRYRFPSREVFAAYEREAAKPLRADGLKRFPPERGVKLTRSVGDEAISLPARPRSPTMQ